MSTITTPSAEDTADARREQEDIAWRAVEWPDSFTTAKLTLAHLQRGYDYPISGDYITRELAYRANTPRSAA